MTTDRPTTLLAELTHRCPLHCPYCSNPLDLIRADAELAPRTGSGCSPRPARWACCSSACRAASRWCGRTSRSWRRTPGASGSTRTLVTSGLGLTRQRAERLRAVGLEHVQISIQDADTASAERIAGVSSVKQKRAAAAIVRELGFAFTVNVVLHRANLDRIGEIIELAASLGADRLELANTQYYGWGLREPRGAHADPGSGDAARRRSPRRR